MPIDILATDPRLGNTQTGVLRWISVAHAPAKGVEVAGIAGAVANAALGQACTDPPGRVQAKPVRRTGRWASLR